MANNNPGAVDPGIPGFVGAAGDGKIATPNIVNPAFSGWASSVVSYQPAAGVDPGWDNPIFALGPVTGDNSDVVSLGEATGAAAPGQITLKFATGIRNGVGPDFAVFENAFGADRAVFAELAFVEVSSDGVNFVRFPSTSLTSAATGAYSPVDPTNVGNLAGKHVNAYGNSWGTPFDLNQLTSSPLVQSGAVKLNAIDEVRLIDITGDGNTHDSAGDPIYDAYPTTGSAGFDLEAIGTLNSWLAGDANHDGRVDVSDLGILASHWQQSLPGGVAVGDFDGDGAVNIADLGILASHWQDGAATFAGVTLPEPRLEFVPVIAALFSRRRFANAPEWMRRRKMIQHFSKGATCVARGNSKRSTPPGSSGRYMPHTGGIVIAFLLTVSLLRAGTATFDDHPLPPDSHYNGSDGAGRFSSGGALFANQYTAAYDSWSGFAYSDVQDTTTPGYGNQYAAITGGGEAGSANYGLIYDPQPYGAAPRITLPFQTVVSGFDVTNTTYTFLALRDGNDGGVNFVRQFGDDPNQPGGGNQGYADYYRLRVAGFNAASAATGSVDFYLADYRFTDNADDYVVSDWRHVDLTALGLVSFLTFSLTTTDVGQFGANTPLYAAIDNLTYVPEPSAPLAGCLLMLAGIRRRL